MTTLAKLMDYIDNRFIENASPSIELDAIIQDPATVEFANGKKLVAKVPSRGGFKTFMLLAELGTNSAAKTWNKKVDSFLRHVQSKHKVKLYADVCSVNRNGSNQNFASIAYSIEQARHGMNSSVHLPLLGD